MTALLSGKDFIVFGIELPLALEALYREFPGLATSDGPWRSDVSGGHIRVRLLSPSTCECGAAARKSKIIDSSTRYGTLMFGARDSSTQARNHCKPPTAGGTPSSTPLYGEKGYSTGTRVNGYPVDLKMLT